MSAEAKANTSNHKFDKFRRISVDMQSATELTLFLLC